MPEAASPSKKVRGKKPRTARGASPTKSKGGAKKLKSSRHRRGASHASSSAAQLTTVDAAVQVQRPWAMHAPSCWVAAIAPAPFRDAAVQASLPWVGHVCRPDHLHVVTRSRYVPVHDIFGEPTPRQGRADAVSQCGMERWSSHELWPGRPIGAPRAPQFEEVAAASADGGREDVASTESIESTLLTSLETENETLRAEVEALRIEPDDPALPTLPTAAGGAASVVQRESRAVQAVLPWGANLRLPQPPSPTCTTAFSASGAEIIIV
jgi:hypothetical protein